MHDPRLSYIYMSKDSLLQCMHEAAAKHGTRLISSISFRCQTKLDLILLNSCSMVGVGLKASLKGGNQIWSEKRIPLNFQIIMSWLKF
jgi:hypothetical protein